jgi:hypothetical protein
MSQTLAGPEGADDAHGFRLVVDEEGQHALVVLAEEGVAQRRTLRISSGIPFNSYSARPWKPSKR